MNALFSLQPDAVLSADGGTKAAILELLAQRFAQTYELDSGVVLNGLSLREDLGSTGFGRGVAIPHARIAELNRPVAALIRLNSPVDFEAADGIPVDLVFGLLSPENAGVAHLHSLAAISRMMRDDRVHEALIQAPNAEAMYALLSNVSDRDAA